MKSYRILGLAILLLASVPVVGAEHDDMAIELDQYVKKAVKKGIPGASLAVVINGDIRLLRGYGVTKKGGKKKIDSAQCSH